jgi:hypothetical protein
MQQKITRELVNFYKIYAKVSQSSDAKEIKARLEDNIEKVQRHASRKRS